MSFSLSGPVSSVAFEVKAQAKAVIEFSSSKTTLCRISCKCPSQGVINCILFRSLSYGTDLRNVLLSFSPEMHVMLPFRHNVGLLLQK